MCLFKSKALLFLCVFILGKIFNYLRSCIKGNSSPVSPPPRPPYPNFPPNPPNSRFRFDTIDAAYKITEDVLDESFDSSVDEEENRAQSADIIKKNHPVRYKDFLP